MRRIVCGLVGVVALTAVSACVGETRVNIPTPTTSTSSSQDSGASSPASATVSVPSSVSIDKTSRYSSGSLVIDCPQQVGSDTGSETPALPTPSLFDQTTGKFIKVPQPEVPAGMEVTRVGCLPSGTAEEPTITYRLSLRTPAQGLEPEKFETKIFTYSTDPTEKPVTATLDLPTKEETVYSMMAGTGGNLLFGTRDANETLLLKPDGTKVASYPVNASDVEYVDENAFVLVDRSDFHNFVKTIYDGRTGSPAAYGGNLEKLDSQSIGYLSADGFVFSTGTYGRVYIDTRNKRRYELNPDDPRSPLTEVQIWGNYAYLAGRGLKVVELDTGRVLVSRTEEEWEGLGVDNWYAADKYLYIENDDDSPVIDVTTGQQVSTGWSQRPSNLVGDAWTLVLPSPVTNDYAQCFMDRTGRPSVMWGMYSLDDKYGCYGTGTLAHSPGGYDGPWY